MLLTFTLFSCTEKEQFIKLSDSNVTMFYQDTKQLTLNYSSDDIMSKIYNYTTSDSTIVKISKTGLVTGVSIGTATIKVASIDGKFNDKCDFTISPKSILYKEPYMVFGSSAANVKANETRTISHETTDSQIYMDTNYAVRNVMYVFKNGKMSSSLVLLTQTTDIATEVVHFLSERYQYAGTTGENYVYRNRKTNALISLSVTSTLGLNVMYIPPSSSSSVQAQTEVKLDRYFSTTIERNDTLSSGLYSHLLDELKMRTK